MTEPLRKLKIVRTDDEVRARMRPDVIWAHALATFRKEFYGDWLHIISAPEVQYDIKADRYAIKFEIAGRKHSMKATNAVAEFVLKLATEQHAYFGFLLEEGVAVDAVAEVFS